jgi:hypothetical protein
MKPGKHGTLTQCEEKQALVHGMTDFHQIESFRLVPAFIKEVVYFFQVFYGLVNHHLPEVDLNLKYVPLMKFN